MDEQPIILKHSITEDIMEDVQHLQKWARDVFLFASETMNMLPSEPVEELRDREIPYTDPMGNKRTAKLFSKSGELLWNDLTVYDREMFKNQDRASFKQYNGTRFTWQQTVILTAYNRAIRTFGKDSFDDIVRWISVRSGHGIGKTADMSVIAIHFLWCFPGAQIGMTANSEQQVEDIFMKEFYVWARKLPLFIQNCIVQTSDHIQIEDDEDWFLRAQVARPEKPEALAGLHGKYVLILVDEASGVADKVYEVMKGALTGDNYVVVYFSNPTRNEGEFFESHKDGSTYTKLHFNSRHSPIVRDGYVDTMENRYPPNGTEHSDEVKIRVDGEFAGVNEMDDKGWIPLFANVVIHFEPEQGQIINRGIIAVDPSGSGKDHTSVGIRDNIYLKEVLNENTSNEKDLARKVETVRDAYNCQSADIGIDAFGVGAKLVANINTKIGESVNALLTDKPRPGTEDRFVTFKDEMAWAFREWVCNGGIIITNNPEAWLKEMRAVKFKRVGKGLIHLMDKPTFKKINSFSPDRFDMGTLTFFKADATRPVILTKNQLEAEENRKFIESTKLSTENHNLSSM
jgi:hypothetical protein